MPASRVHPALVAVWVAGLSGCPTLRPETQSFPCDTGADCVAGFVCADSGFCEPEGVPDGGDGERVVDPVCGFAWSTARALEGGWVRQFGGPSGEFVSGVVALPGGGLVIAGGVPSTEDALAQDAFVAFAAPDGAFISCDLLASSDATRGDSLAAITVTADGDVLVAGTTGGDVGGGVATDVYGDVLLARYAPSGERRWVRQLDFSDERGASHEGALALAVDGAGRTWLLGATTGSFPGHPEESGVERTVGFVASLDDAGAVRDGRLVSGEDDPWVPQGAHAMANGVAFAATSRLSLLGTVDGLDRAFFSVVAATETSGEVGVRVLAEAVSDEGVNSGVSVFGALATDVGGGRWLFGDLLEGATIGGVPSAGSYDGILARLDGAGGFDHVWALGGTTADGVTGGGLGESSVWLAGNASGAVGAGPMPGASTDAAVWSVPRAGSGPATAWQMGGVGQERAAGAFALRADSVVVTGDTNSDLVGPTWGENDLFLWSIGGVTP